MWSFGEKLLAWLVGLALIGLVIWGSIYLALRFDDRDDFKADCEEAGGVYVHQYNTTDDLCLDVPVLMVRDE